MIAVENRNDVRIIELPACKMVWSGVCKDGSNTMESKQLKQFSEWWSAQDKLRSDRFYARDFMWYDHGGSGLAWGLAVSEVPADTDAFEVIDFPGGLYAVANYADNDAEGAYISIKKWVDKSGCFALDEGRNYLWHSFACCTGTLNDVMGYSQYDFYFPIQIMEEAK